MNGEEHLAPILIADDESEDLFLLEKSLRKAGAKNPILGFDDGAELLEFLSRAVTEHRSVNEIAEVLFLDIKMPLVNGFDTLRWIRANDVVRLLRVVIVSGSDHPRDHEEAAALGVSRYLEKYPSADTLAAVMAERD